MLAGLIGAIGAKSNVLRVQADRGISRDLKKAIAQLSGALSVGSVELLTSRLGMANIDIWTFDD